MESYHKSHTNARENDFSSRLIQKRDQPLKGLLNMPGENNCFLNSAVQVLWHLDSFRRSFRLLSSHYCQGRQSCIFCALKVVFTQFQYSDRSALANDTLRRALANAFTDTQRYQLGHMDDAAECFENILQRVHFHTVQPDLCVKEICHAAHCIPHRKFGMQIREEMTCRCGGHSQSPDYLQMIQYVSVSALVSQVQNIRDQGAYTSELFGQILHKASTVGDWRDCPKNCGRKVQIRRTLASAPDVVSLGLVWDSDQSDSRTVAQIAHSIGTSIRLVDLFHFAAIDESLAYEHLELFGVVCYHGKHYSSFVRHNQLDAWIYFDDADWHQVSPRWSDSANRIAQGRYQPLLLLYTRSDPDPIDAEGALEKTEPAPAMITQTSTSQNNSLTRRAMHSRNNSLVEEGLLGGNPYLNSAHACSMDKAPLSEYITSNVVKSVLQQQHHQKLTQMQNLRGGAFQIAGLAGLRDSGYAAEEMLIPKPPQPQSLIHLQQARCSRIGSSDHRLPSNEVLASDGASVAFTNVEIMGFRQQYEDLCAKGANLFRQSEQQHQQRPEDAKIALFHLTQATICYKQATETPYISAECRQVAEARHLECLRRCQVLHSTVMSISQQDNGRSTRSDHSDSTASSSDQKKQQVVNLSKQTNNMKPAPPERTTSINKSDNQSSRTIPMLPCKQQIDMGSTSANAALETRQREEKRTLFYGKQTNNSKDFPLTYYCSKCRSSIHWIIESNVCMHCDLKKELPPPLPPPLPTRSTSRTTVSRPLSILGMRGATSVPSLSNALTSNSTQSASLNARNHYYQHLKTNVYNNASNSTTLSNCTGSATSLQRKGSLGEHLDKDNTSEQPAHQLSLFSSSQPDVNVCTHNNDGFQVSKSTQKLHNRFAIGATRPDKLSVLKKRKTRGLDSMQMTSDTTFCNDASNFSLHSAPSTPATVKKNVTVFDFAGEAVQTCFDNAEDRRSSCTLKTEKTAIRCNLCLKECQMQSNLIYCETCIRFIQSFGATQKQPKR